MGGRGSEAVSESRKCEIESHFPHSTFHCLLLRQLPPAEPPLLIPLCRWPSPTCAELDSLFSLFNSGELPSPSISCLPVACASCRRCFEYEGFASSFLAGKEMSLPIFTWNTPIATRNSGWTRLNWSNRADFAARNSRESTIWLRNIVNGSSLFPVDGELRRDPEGLIGN